MINKRKHKLMSTKMMLMKRRKRISIRTPVCIRVTGGGQEKFNNKYKNHNDDDKGNNNSNNSVNIKLRQIDYDIKFMIGKHKQSEVINA